MAPVKFEQNIRKKIQEREIMPSKDAWSKLSNQLQEQPVNKNNKMFWTMVAASFVGILLITTFFFNNKKEQITNQIVDENPSEKIKEVLTEKPSISNDLVIAETSKEIVEAEILKDNFSKYKKLQVTTNNKHKKKKEKEEKEEKEENTLLVHQDFKEVLIVNSKEENIIIKDSIELKQDLFSDNKVKEVVAIVQKIKKENNSVTLEEINALLLNAQRAISNNKILNSNTSKIDAMALLIDVEVELEQSFRDKVFDMLGEGFTKVRTAVVNRNN